MCHSVHDKEDDVCDNLSQDWTHPAEIRAMTDNDTTADTGAELDRPPFLYEIRVKGRLSAEQWSAWFDDLTVTSDEGGSTLRGRVPDHSALYGLLGRLRDLAVPLLAVKVLDADAQLKLSRLGRRYDLLINLMFITLYLLLLGGLTTITVLVAPVLNVALALALLFALLAALAHAFWLWTGERLWRWAAYLAWAGAAASFLIFIPVSGLLPPALGLALTFFLAAGGLYFLLNLLRRKAQGLRSRLAGTAPENRAE
jgi:hypothetical protein